MIDFALSFQIFVEGFSYSFFAYFGYGKILLFLQHIYLDGAFSLLKVVVITLIIVFGCENFGTSLHPHRRWELPTLNVIEVIIQLLHPFAILFPLTSLFLILVQDAHMIYVLVILLMVFKEINSFSNSFLTFFFVKS